MGSTFDVMTVSRKTFCARVVDVANAGVAEDRFFTYLSGTREDLNSCTYVYCQFIVLCVFSTDPLFFAPIDHHRSISTRVSLR